MGVVKTSKHRDSSFYSTVGTSNQSGEVKCCVMGLLMADDYDGIRPLETS
jgi:hypothetical protein